MTEQRHAGRKALVIGSTGRIGIWLVRELLAQGAQVRAGVHPGRSHEGLDGLDVERVALDIIDPQTLKKAMRGIDDVYNLSSVISMKEQQRALMASVNVDGPRNVARAAIECGVRRLMATGSCDAYRASGSGQIISDDDPLDPGSHIAYVATKAQGMQTTRSFVGQGVKIVIICPTGVVGPMDLEPSLMGQSILEALRTPRGKVAQLVDASFDHVDVRDLVATMARALDLGQDGATYLVGGSLYPVRAFSEAILRERDGDAFRVKVLPIGTVKALMNVRARSLAMRGQIDDGMLTAVDLLSKQPVFDDARARRELGHLNRPVRETIDDTVKWLYQHRG